MKLPPFRSRPVLIPMRGFFYAACCLASMVAPGISSVQAQRADDVRAAQESTPVADPSEVFLRAYTSVKQGEALEADGKLHPALAKYRFAASLIEQLSQTNPNWQPLLIQYRSRKTTEKIRALEEKLALQPPPDTGLAPGDQTNAGSGGVPAEDDDLPVADAQTGGSDGGRVMALPAAQVPGIEPISVATSKLADSLHKSQEQLKKTQDALAAAQKDKQDAIRQLDELQFKVRSNNSSNKIIQKRLDRLMANRNELQKDLDTAQARLKEALTKNPDATEARKELRDQVATLKKSLAKAEADTTAAQKERDTTSQKLAEAETRNTKLTEERDKALAEAVPSQEAVEKIKALQTENEALNQKLAAAEGTITQLTTEALKKKEELEGMQKELVAVKAQLATTRDQQDRSETTITELRQKLDDDAKKLAEAKSKGMSSEDFARLTNENNLLKGIVVRQLKADANRALARKLVSDELARLEVQSNTLNEQMEQLAKPTMPLTDEERNLFKEPVPDVATSAEAAAMANKITAVKVTKSPAQASPSPGESPGATGTPDANEPDTAVVSTTTTDEASTTAPQVDTTSQPKVSEELQAMARQAEESFNRGKFEDAQEAYTKMLARDPKNIYLLSNQGAVLSRQNKLKQAEVTLKKAVAVNPKDAFTLSTLGIVYYRMHRYDDALECLTKAVQYDPKNATAHNYLGITSSQKGWPEAATEELQKALAINPQYADAHFNIAVIYATNQPPQKDQAKEHYKLATSLGSAPDPALEKIINKK